MKVTFEQGARYRVRLKLPAAISPKVALTMLQSKLADVMIGKTERGIVTAEATWRAPNQVVDSVFILKADRVT